MAHAKQIELKNDIDSINYVYGRFEGSKFCKDLYEIKDSERSAVAKACYQALTEGWEGSVSIPSDASMYATYDAYNVRYFEKHGLMGKTNWIINEPIYYQGFLDGFYNVTTPTTTQLTVFRLEQLTNQRDVITKKAKVKKNALSDKTVNIKLKTYLDSINYAYGYELGEKRRPENEANLRSSLEEYISTFNKTLKTKVRFPIISPNLQLYGHNLSKQDYLGEQIPLAFECFRQGFIDEVANTSNWDMTAAMQYAQKAIAIRRGRAFFAENAKRPEIKTTNKGIQYEVLKAAKGKTPKATDKVNIHYTGTYFDGTVFDASDRNGKPVTIDLKNATGWTETLLLMQVGSTYKLYIPYYGDGASTPPYATLIITVELLGIQ